MPENILLQTGEFSKVLLVDFGLAKVFINDHLVTVCGTPNYLPPELLSLFIGFPVYAKYIKHKGQLPFGEEDEILLYRHILRGTVSFYDPVWLKVSSDGI
ncbi:hypothetical protein ROZALSC1DRAFT_27603 [Rozella allomycis CSF55]|uniref:Protein kinase domain-containing protein n=1 Tax=Rozella allomycis (strain CSF55) TaxID=988480 RepID=A0A075AQU7_ROZAC|nr:hypothetical protein O9G_004134 [Rozella allomycis CSF55]RKP20952.1 hypothetical protein ROZALSC1DRAFT_27603 [Rozella allomycis CSF55]|eukprot:EPZ32560.1 hypothetical protein O9G_004134 [Rozella allomycis CSF55]